MPLFTLNRDHRSVLQPAHQEIRQVPARGPTRAVAFDNPDGEAAVITPTAPRRRAGGADGPQAAPTPLSRLPLRSAPPSSLAKGAQAAPRAITALLHEIERTRGPAPSRQPLPAAASGQTLGADGAYLTEEGQRVVADGTAQAPRSALGDGMLDQLNTIQDAYELLGETPVVGDDLFQRMQDLDDIARFMTQNVESVRLAWQQASALQAGRPEHEIQEMPEGLDPAAPPAYVPALEALQTLEALTADAAQQLADRRNYLAHTVNEAPTEAGKMYSAKAQICDGAVAILDRRIDAAENRGDEFQIASRRKSTDGRPLLTRAQLHRLKATRDALKARAEGLGRAAQDAAGQLARPRDVVGPKMLGGFKALRHLPTWARQKAELASHLKTLAGKPGGSSSLDTPVVDEQAIVDTALAQAFREAGLSPAQALQEMHGEMRRQRNAQPWDPITTEIQLQVGAETSFAYSEITPAAAFFPSYEGQGVNAHCSTEGRHAVNLAQTRLVDGQGRELFCAMRHAVVSAFGIVEKNIDRAHMSDEELTEVVVNAAPEHSIGAAGRGANVAGTAAHVRKNAATVVPAVRAAANVRRAEEIVQAMIVTDRELFDRALLAAQPMRPQVLGRSSTTREYEPPPLDVLSISLLTPDHLRSGVDSNERLMLADQLQAWSDIKGERTFTVPHPDTGEEVQVKVNVRPHTVNYGVNQGAVKGIGPFTPGANFVSGWDDVTPVNDQVLLHLIGVGGPATTPEETQLRFERSLLGPRLLALHAEADLAANKVADLLAREAACDVLSDERDENGSSERLRARAAFGPQIDVAAAAAIAARQRATLAQELLDQVREIHRDGSYRTAGKEAYKMPARLALLGHMLGVKVAFNCKSGKDRTGELDAEVKHLRLQMELTGHVPHPGRDRTPTERDHFHEVMSHSGNFEMQRLNTGYAGYKLHGVEELFAEFGAEGPDDPKVANFHGLSGYIPG